TNIFTRDTIVKLISMIKTIVQSIIENPEISVDYVDIIAPEEKKYLTVIGYKEVPMLFETDFASLFENQVKKTPDNRAIQYNSTSITYKELNIRANQLAHYLLEKGIKKEERIAVYQPASPDIIIALAAIMKTGATYVPISPQIPENRLHYILDDSETKTVIISGKKLFLSTYSKAINIIDMEEMSPVLDGFTVENCLLNIPLSAPAYINYTSGTTGNPKGVITEQKGIGNLFQAQSSILKLHDSERILQFAEIDFDASISEIILALFSGNTLVMCDEETRKDPEKLKDLLNKEKITLATLPPIMLSHLSTEIPSLKKIISAGDSCSIDIVKKWLKDERFLFNAYGPTEGTVCSTIGELHATDKGITIGKPIDNVEVTIRDDKLQLVPRHITGEICISGINLARGYIHPEKISPYPFIKHPDPISFDPEKNHSLLYKTGDLGRWDEDGNIEFLGRKDRQIKLHGYRIELAEIESVLNNIEGVIDSFVLLRNKESPVLVAFIQGDMNKISQNMIISELKRILPAYMIPGFFIFLDNWPLTPHNKKDPDKLYEMITQNTMSGYKHKIFPRNPIEESILEIWRDVLHMDEISIDDNFFKLGGHSLQMTRVVSRMREQLSIDIPLHVIFENPTIMALSGQVEDFRNTLTSTLPMPTAIKNKGDFIPLSPSQERMWFVHQLEPESIAYNILVAIRLKKKVNPEILNQCFQEIIRRHDILRTIFIVKDGHPVQIVRKEINNYFNLIDISGLSKDDREIKRHTIQNEEARFLFNLKAGPLIRVTIIRISDEELISILHMHHIISDQWSVGNIVNELNILYKSHIEGIEPALPVLPLQYSDYTLWQHKYFIEDNLQRDINYWKEQLKDLPVLTLPQDKPRPLTQTYAGAHIIIPLDDSLIERIKMLNAEYHSTTFMFLLTIFYIFVYRYTGMKDIPIGVPNANRNFSSIENSIGTFVNTLVIRVALDDDLFFKDLLNRVKQISLDAFAHKDLPFNKLVEIMDPERDSSHLPLVQIFFNIANAPLTGTILDELSWEIVELDEIGVQFDLTLTIELTKLKQIIFSYNKDLFQGESIRQMAHHYHTLIRDILENPYQIISKIPLINDYEKKQMLYKWNDTIRSYPKDSVFSEIFEQVVRQRSTTKAIFFDTMSITFKELNRQA
ncbi:MAG: amino acid adenylation domain-containing protein, partial [Spirochaetales bacterium]|nr:amino acid adenylation domain-containing protein [Spirochaetales bacterium]